MKWFDPKALLDPAAWPGAAFLLLVILVVATLASWALKRIIRRSAWMMDRYGRHTDETAIRYALLVKTVVVYLAAAITYASLIPALQSLLHTMVASAGILVVVVGIAARSTLANLVSGFTLAVYRPFRIGDLITLESETGTVEDITLRHTVVRTWENKRLVIPNEKIDSMSLINHSLVDSKLMLPVNVGISYESDMDLARRLMVEEAVACPHALPQDQAPAPPLVRMMELGDWAVNLRLFVWVPDMKSFYAARSHLLEAIKRSFHANGVEIPYPHRIVIHRDRDGSQAEPVAGD